MPNMIPQFLSTDQHDTEDTDSTDMSHPRPTELPSIKSPTESTCPDFAFSAPFDGSFQISRFFNSSNPPLPETPASFREGLPLPELPLSAIPTNKETPKDATSENDETPPASPQTPTVTSRDPDISFLLHPQPATLSIAPNPPPTISVPAPHPVPHPVPHPAPLPVPHTAPAPVSAAVRMPGYQMPNFVVYPPYPPQRFPYPPPPMHHPHQFPGGIYLPYPMPVTPAHVEPKPQQPDISNKPIPQILQNIAARIAIYQFPKEKAPSTAMMKLDLDPNIGNMKDVMTSTLRLIRLNPFDTTMLNAKRNFLTNNYYDSYSLKPNYPSNRKTSAVSLLIYVCANLSVSHEFSNITIVKYREQDNDYLLHKNHFNMVHQLWRKAQLMQKDKTGTTDLIRLSKLTSRTASPPKDRDVCVSLVQDATFTQAEFEYWVCTLYIFLLFLKSGDDSDTYHFTIPSI